MNRFFTLYIVTLLGLQFTLNSCKTDEIKLLPVLTTLEITDISEATAYSGGDITSDGGFDIIGRGICLSKLPEPMIKDTITSDSVGSGSFVSHITKLSPNTTYYVRAYATNKNGTSYGGVQTFSTKQLTLTTDSVSSITVNSATCSATIKTTGNVINVTERGICWDTQSAPTVLKNKISAGSGSGNFTCSISNLSLSTTYYARMYVTNSSGTYYGNEITFSTKDGIANLNANTPFSISSNAVSLSATITSDGGSFISESGFCWSKSTNPTINDNKTSVGTGIGSFSASLQNLSPNTKYYICAYAINNVHTTYSEPIIITTNEILKDIDGNSYNTVTIGTQTWMAENLKTTKFTDGTAIQLVLNGDSWGASITSAYCWYNNDETANKEIYGALYNGYAVKTGKLAPKGWHVPSQEEWVTLKNVVSKNVGQSISVGKALATTSHWTIISETSYYSKNYIGYNLTINNSSGFSALPGGSRRMESGVIFNYLGDVGIWWTTTQYNSYSMRGMNLKYYSSTIEGDSDSSQGANSYELSDGFSVRCIKD